jgi:hypothetical protein
MAAAKGGEPKLVALLLARGAEPAKAAEDGQTAQNLATGEARDLLD